MRTQRCKWLASILAIAVLIPCAVNAQDAFPTKPITVIVPTMGGTVDLIARLVAPGLSKAWGKPVVVETKAGASGNIAAGLVAKAPADGYTILAAYNPLAISSFLFPKLTYNLSELAPITLAVTAPQILAVNTDLPASNVAQFIALAKSKGGSINYASISPGSASHLTMELFRTRAHIPLNHVPYKGAAPAVNDLLGKTVDAGFFAAANVIQYVKAGRLRALAVSGGKRLSSMPEVPTVAESGFPGFDATIWIGFMAPAGTPSGIISQYQREIASILRNPDIRSRVEALDFEVVGSTPEIFRDFIGSEITTWGDIAKQVNVRLD